MGGLVRLNRITRKKVVGMGKVWAVKNGEGYDLHSGMLTYCSAASIKVWNGRTLLGMIMMHKGLEECSITKSNLQKALAILDPRRPRFRLEVTDVRIPGGLFCSSFVDQRAKGIYLQTNPEQGVIQGSDTLLALCDIITSSSFDSTQSRYDIQRMALEDTSGLEISVCPRGKEVNSFPVLETGLIQVSTRR